MRNFLALLLLLITTTVYGAEFRGGGLVMQPELVSASGGTKVLTVNDLQVIEVGGTLGHTIQLPDAVDVGAGWIVYVINNTSSLSGVVIRDDASNIVATLYQGDKGTFTLLEDSTPTGRWAVEIGGPSGGSGGGTSANINLSNLGATAINDDLLPDTSGSYDLGSPTLSWDDVYAQSLHLVGGSFEADQVDDSATGNIDQLASAGRYQIRLVGVAPVLRGIAAPTSDLGQELVLINASGLDLLVENQHATPLAADRILTGTGAAITVPVDGTIRLVYDGTTNRWRVSGGSGGGGAADAVDLTYTPTTPADWDTPPTTGQEAFDELGARTTDAEAAIVTAQTAADDAQADIDAHVSDPTAAHAASAIENTPAGNLAATDVQGALNELQTENDGQGTAIAAAQGDATQALADAATADGKAVAAQADADQALLDAADAQSAADAAQLTADNHIADTTDAHDASAISFAPNTDMDADDAQEAIEDLNLAKAKRTNWLVNEGFEYSTPTTGWTCTLSGSASATTSFKKEGKQSLDMAFSTSTGDCYQSITPPIDLKAGDDVETSIWVKTSDANVQVCYLAAGAEYECQSVSSENEWIKYSFLKKYSGSGTVGVKVKRAVAGSAVSAYADAAYIGEFSGPTPAQIKVGDTFFGSTIWPDNGSCTFTASATGAYADMSPSSCSGTPISKGQFGVPSSFAMGIPIAKLPKGRYRVYVNGVLSASTSVQVTYRITDGTNSTDALLFTENVAYRAGPSWADLEVPSDLYGVTLKLQAKASSGTPTIYNYSGNPVRISMDRLYDYGSLAGAIITDEPWEYLSSKMTTRVTSTPDAEGEYRSYAKNGSAFTGTDAAPATAPSTANGFKLTAVAYGSSGGASGEQRYEFFVGKDLTVLPEWYSSTGRTGAIDTTFREYGGSTLASGVSWNYDPVSGVIFVDVIPQSTSTTSRYVGWTIPTAGGAYSQSATGYFDFKLFKNPLAAGMKTAEDYVRLYGGAGYGSTGTKVRRFTSTESKGDAITCTDSATAGAYCTINKDGYYDMGATERRNGTVTTTAGISRNASSLTTNIYSLSMSEIVDQNLCYGTDAYCKVGRGMPLKKGDIIRSHNDGIGDNTSDFVSFWISKTPSPFEVAGGAGATLGGGPVYSANITNSGTATLTSQKGNWLSSITHNNPGDVTLNIPTGIFSSAPNCVCSAKGGFGRVCSPENGNTTTSVKIYTSTGGGTGTNYSFEVQCQ